MSRECDVALSKAAEENEEVRLAVETMMKAQAMHHKGMMDDLYQASYTEGRPSPSDMPDEFYQQVADDTEFFRAMSEEETTEYRATGWNAFWEWRRLAQEATANGAPQPDFPPEMQDFIRREGSFGGMNRDRTAGSAGEPAADGGGAGRADDPEAEDERRWRRVDAVLGPLKQIRVASMLSNPWTHVKNITATGGMLGLNYVEQGTAILLSKMTPGESRSWWEMYHMGQGMLRAWQQLPAMYREFGKIAGKKGAVESQQMAEILKNYGFSPELAITKQDITLDDTGLFGTTDNRAAGMFNWMFNASFGSQFTALQASDVLMKSLVYDMTTTQLLSRKGAGEGLMGERLDNYITENFEQMREAVRSGNIPPELEEAHRASVKAANELTFTEQPQTELGKLIAGQWDTDTFWKKGLSETMQVLVPFRQIYVNLMRQTLSRRLLAPLDPITRGELMGKNGKAAQELAQARFLGAWGIAGGTWATLEMLGGEIYGPSDFSAAQRDFMFAAHGKVGNTMRMGELYVPFDMIPPSIGIPMAYFASLKEAVGEMQYRYATGEDVSELVMKGMSPVMSAALDGPWIREYMDALSKINRYAQQGDMPGLLQYFASVTVSPLKMPDWISKIVGEYDPSVTTTDGIIGKIRTDLWTQADAYSHRRNIYGYEIPKNLRDMKDSDKPYYDPFMQNQDVTEFLAAMQYEKEFGRNVSYVIPGIANGTNGVASGADDIRMNHRQRSLFEYYAGRNFADAVRMNLLNDASVWDKRNKRLRIPAVDARKRVKSIRRQLNAIARDLVKIHPTEGTVQQQIEMYRKLALRNGVIPENELNGYLENMLNVYNNTRAQVMDQFN